MNVIATHVVAAISSWIDGAMVLSSCCQSCRGGGAPLATGVAARSTVFGPALRGGHVVARERVRGAEASRERGDGGGDPPTHRIGALVHERAAVDDVDDARRQGSIVHPREQQQHARRLAEVGGERHWRRRHRPRPAPRPVHRSFSC